MKLAVASLCLGMFLYTAVCEFGLEISDLSCLLLNFVYVGIAGIFRVALFYIEEIDLLLQLVPSFLDLVL